MERDRYMSPMEAQDFGIIDRVLVHPPQAGKDEPELVQKQPTTSPSPSIPSEPSVSELAQSGTSPPSSYKPEPWRGVPVSDRAQPLVLSVWYPNVSLGCVYHTVLIKPQPGTVNTDNMKSNHYGQVQVPITLWDFILLICDVQKALWFLLIRITNKNNLTCIGFYFER